ncbi:MAG TPA: hypothetical protein VHK68_12680 [Gemmatimonadales bacterium]|nr:hypothetical protein [Gemmatimonadales bacterium]
MRKSLHLTLLAAILCIFFSGASAAEQSTFTTLDSGISLFAASDDEAGLEMWRSDGTSAGTFRLTDDACNDYCEQYNSFFAPWIKAGNRAFVLAQEGDMSTLWVTDGSREGTFPVFEGMRIWNLTPPVWVKNLGRLFFVVNRDFGHDYELWCSDGTPEGTRKVKTFVSADSRGGIRELTAFQGRAFFNGQDALNGPSLWSSDGTETGTVLVRSFFRDQEQNDPSWLRVVGAQLLFIAPTPNAGTVLWKSDGTHAGTLPIRILQAGQNSYATLTDSRVAGGLLFFSTVQQLWVSNGTADGTRPLTPLLGTPPALSQESLFKGRYYFEASTESDGWEIWSTDGTRAGTRMLADLCPGDCSGVFPGSLRAVRNRLLFTVHNPAGGGAKLWQSDGTVQGTRMIQTNRDYQRTGDGPVQVAAGHVLFTASYPPAAPPQLWRTDGTKMGTFPISDFIGYGASNELIGEIPGALLLRIVNETGLDQLWVSNGTRPGTLLLKTIRAGE